jgi:transmembrane sensor
VEDVQLRIDSGEVLVDRTPSQSKPVRVTAGPAAIEALTQARFSIRLTTTACLVRVFDGEVRVRPVAAFMTVNLQSGQMATIAEGRLRVEEFPLASAPRLLSWMEGKLMFDGASLAEVVSEFNRYNREQIFIEDESFAQFRIGGSYTATNPMGFAKALRATFGIRAEARGSGGSQPRGIVLKGDEGGHSPSAVQ